MTYQTVQNARRDPARPGCGEKRHSTMWQWPGPEALFFGRAVCQNGSSFKVLLSFLIWGSNSPPPDQELHALQTEQARCPKTAPILGSVSLACSFYTQRLAPKAGDNPGVPPWVLAEQIGVNTGQIVLKLLKISESQKLRVAMQRSPGC